MRRAASMLASSLVMALSVVGCAGPETGPLTEPSRWAEVASSEDPYDDRPEGASCDAFGWVLEGDIVEVQTDVCDYVTLEQGLLRGVRPGETITVDVWNLGLWAETPTQAHVSVELGDDRWEARPDIPSPAAHWEARFEPDAPLPAGTPIYLHLHNHGANSWRFGPPRAP